jgi:cell division septum initiation protein DivIVA
MMTKDDLSVLCDQLERGLRQYKAFEMGVESVKKLSNLFQVESDITKRVAEVQAELDALVLREQEALSKVEVARETANEILGKASDEADGIVKDAANRADVLLIKANADLDTVREIEAAVSLKVEERRRDLKDVEESIGARAGELKRLEQVLESHKKKLQEILG